MLIAIGKQVVIELDEKGDEKTLESGIILPELKDVPCKGVIKSIGLDVPVSLGLMVNDRVQFKMWAGEDAILGEEKYKVVHYQDVIVKMTE